MAEIWSFVETGQRGLRKTAPAVASEAVKLGRLTGQPSCGVFAADSEAGGLATGLSAFGLRKFYHLKAREPLHWTPEACADALAALAESAPPYLILFAATAAGSEVAARVAARLGAGLISNCVDFVREGETLVARKVAYGGKAHTTMTWCAPPPYLATMDLDSLEATEQPGAPAEMAEQTLPVGPLRAEFLGSFTVDPQEIDLTEANLVLGVGRPVIDRADRLEELQGAAGSCGAAFGGSRPVVDAGLLPRARQIGASGKWLAADVYVACGISGSTYHMMGIREVRHLIAVNSDPGAPILKQAELGIVADLFEVLPALKRLMDGRTSPTLTSMAANCSEGADPA